MNGFGTGIIYYFALSWPLHCCWGKRWVIPHFGNTVNGKRQAHGSQTKLPLLPPPPAWEPLGIWPSEALYFSLVVLSLCFACFFIIFFFSGSYSNQCLLKLHGLQKPGNTLAGVIFSFHPGPRVCQIKIHTHIYMSMYGCVSTGTWIHCLSSQVLNGVMFIEILGFHI